MEETPLIFSPEFVFDSTAMVIYGGGGHAKTIIDLVRTLGTYQIAGIIDDGLPVGSQVMGLKVLGGADQLDALRRSGIRFAINAVGGIGNVAVRLKVFNTLAQAGFICPSVVHPTAWIETSACLEGGVQVLAKSYISSESKIGFGTVINAGVVVSHDCTLGRCVNLSPGAMLAGGVQIEDFSQVGMNATINLNVTIGSGCRIGNGATIKANVPPNTVVRAGSIWPIPTGQG